MARVARVAVVAEVRVEWGPAPPTARVHRGGADYPGGGAEAGRREPKGVVPTRDLHRHHRRTHPQPAPRRRVGVPNPNPHRTHQDPHLLRRLLRLQPGGDVAHRRRLLPLEGVREDGARRPHRHVLRVAAREADARPLLRPRPRRAHHLAGNAQLHRPRRRNIPPDHQVAGGGRRQSPQRPLEEEARSFPHSVAESGNSLFNSFIN